MPPTPSGEVGRTKAANSPLPLGRTQRFGWSGRTFTGKDGLMTLWNADDIARIAATDDLHIAPFRADGKTTGTPTWIWSVVVDGRLFVRAWNGTRSSWYRSAIAQRAGRITAAGSTFEVSFAPADGSLQGQIDDAYRAKYAGSSYLPPMVAAGPQEATVEITPRSGN